MALTAAEEAYFQKTLSRIKYSVNFWVPVEVMDHETLKGWHKNALGICWAEDDGNGKPIPFKITIDEYFVQECFAALEAPYMKVEPETLEEVIAHEIAHLHCWRHGKKHTELTQYICRLIKAGKPHGFKSCSDKHSETGIYDENERATEAATVEEPLHYRNLLTQKIRNATKDFNTLNDFEKFVLDRGFEFQTEADLKAGYDRLWKARHGVLLSEKEFLLEAKPKDMGTAADVYSVLIALVEKKALTVNDVYQYARFKWCLNDPLAIVAYQKNRDKWIVNNCAVKITEDAARVKVCEEFGFETSCVKIIGTPYYDATDWNFIRFNCAGWHWLMKDGDICKVYD